MFDGPEKQEFDPRSPVQHGGSNAGLFLLAVVIAIAIWAMQQLNIRDIIPKSSSSSSERRPPPPSKPETQPQSDQGASPASGRLSGLFTGDDYPAEALDANEQGAVGVRVIINEQGRVSACAVVQSSGHKSLDDATCRIVTSRARFTPARDRHGNSTPSSYTQTVKWQIAE